MTGNLDEEIQKSRLERAQKDAAYYKWLSANAHVSDAMKKRARSNYHLCNTFSPPMNDEDFAKLQETLSDLEYIIDGDGNEEVLKRAEERFGY